MPATTYPRPPWWRTSSSRLAAIYRWVSKLPMRWVDWHIENEHGLLFAVELIGGVGLGLWLLITGINLREASKEPCAVKHHGQVHVVDDRGRDAIEDYEWCSEWKPGRAPR